ncbi:hypothetical protein TCAP_05937 [Tolypocladium capitatum]|uniref:Uncharacterized protein n=1 Tax=Tolypocladium capitatum TaxID=45235 RepID=A0A2K3Q9A1_9HYPO|nr:hypothetical protein TCAP_05937 [Tolypocladium capitatum]
MAFCCAERQGAGRRKEAAAQRNFSIEVRPTRRVESMCAGAEISGCGMLRVTWQMELPDRQSG